MSVFLHNGQILAEDHPLLLASSRAYRYGDGFFESMKFSWGRLMYPELHVQRIKKSLILLKMPMLNDLDENWLESFGKQMASKAGAVNGRIRFTFYRESSGFYTPTDAATHYLAEFIPQKTGEYEWDEQGMRIGVYKEMTKNANFTSMIKTTSALLYVMAGIYADENGFEECAILNDQGRIAEGISSNIFVSSSQFIITPPVGEYCIDGVMRKVVMNLAQAYGYQVLEQPLTEITLAASDEIFFTNASRGIRWVNQYNGKAYGHSVSKVLHQMLNKHIDDIKGADQGTLF